MNKTIAILTAMSVEHRQILAMLSDVREEQHGPYTYSIGLLGPNRIVLLQCGIGKVNATAGVVDLILHYRPQCVVSTGVAGGIDSHLEVMDVVVGTHTCHHDVWCGDGYEPGQVQGLPARFEGDPVLLRKATALQADVRIVPGLILTGDRFITSHSEQQSLKQAYPDALAVDMESAAIAQACYLYGLPFVSIRIISDTPGAEGHFQQYLNFWQTMADRSFSVTRASLSSLLTQSHHC